MNPPPPEEPERKDSKSEGSEKDAPRKRMVPPADPKAKETKRMMVADQGGERPGLELSVGGREIGATYGRSRVLADLAALVDKVVEAATGGVTVIYRLQPGNSMSFVFGDAPIEEAQGELEFNQTLVAARSIARLIAAEGADEAFVRGMEAGAAAKVYTEIAGYAAHHQLELGWEPAGDKKETLTPGKAQAHFDRLSRPPEFVDDERTINGKLYRVITMDAESEEGSVGIDIYPWSYFPPGYSRRGRRKIILPFHDPEVQEQIKNAQLIGEPVEAAVAIRHPKPGTGIELKVERELLAIQPGEGAESHLGPRIVDVYVVEDDDEA